MRRAVITLGVGVALATAGCRATDDGPRAASDRAREVGAAGCSGADALATGVDIGDGMVVTVAHALRGASTITVDDQPATVLALDRRTDAAVLSTGRRLPALSAGAGRPGRAALVTDHGTRPVAIARRVTLEVDEPRDATTHERAGLVLDTAIAPGDSGAGVVDATGRLVGMVFATSRDGHRSYAVAGDELARVVAEATSPSGPVDLGGC